MDYRPEDLRDIEVRCEGDEPFMLRLSLASATDLAAFCNVTHRTPQQVLRLALEAYVREPDWRR